MEQRLVEIELKVIGLEDTVQQLNERIWQQQKQLDELRALCRLLLRRQEEHEGAGSLRADMNERPPHY